MVSILPTEKKKSLITARRQNARGRSRGIANAFLRVKKINHC